MTTTEHRTGTVQSGDVRLFYRLFGEAGETPVVIIHGANYYDSADWIVVAAALAGDRQVVSADTRGFGESGRSASKNYSLDALTGDVDALLDHLGWPQAIIMGHSMGGRTAIVHGARFSERAAGVIIVDHCPGRGGSAARPAQSVGKKQEVFASVEAAQKVMSRDPDAPPGSAARARLEQFLKPVEGGFSFPRDPDFGNTVPLGAGDDDAPKIQVASTWDELAAIRCPTLIVRATKSDRYGEADLERVRTEFPRIRLIEVDCGHDVANGAPGPLIDGVLQFLLRDMAGR